MSEGGEVWGSVYGEVQVAQVSTGPVGPCMGSCGVMVGGRRGPCMGIP